MSIDSQRRAVKAHIESNLESIRIARNVMSGKTLEQAGADEGVTRERIRQRVSRAFRVCRREEHRPNGDTEFLWAAKTSQARKYKDQWLDQLNRVEGLLLKELEDAS